MSAYYLYIFVLSCSSSILVIFPQPLLMTPLLHFLPLDAGLPLGLQGLGVVGNPNFPSPSPRESGRVISSWYTSPRAEVRTPRDQQDRVPLALLCQLQNPSVRKQDLL